MPVPPVDKVLYHSFVIFVLFLVLNAFERPAYAYVDPGSGLLVVQFLGTTFAGVSFLLRKRIRQLFERFARSRREIGSDSEQS
jgi:hypothetical protein